MDITILMDNEAGDGLLAEWGLSCAVQDGGSLTLWDCGQTEGFLDNARELGLDLSKAEVLALSHGHYDHAGGLPALMEAGFTGTIYAHPEATKERFSTRHDPPESIGIQSVMPSFEPVRESFEIAKGVTMVTDIPRIPGNFEAVPGFAFDREGTQRDAVIDDAFLLLDTPRGPVVLLGCCHSGLANSLDVLKTRHGIEKVHAIVGGLHLYNADKDQTEQALNALRNSGAKLIVPGHCTGEKATLILGRELKAIVRPMHSGMRLEF